MARDMMRGRWLLDMAEKENMDQDASINHVAVVKAS
jgi:hypothetical protein